MLVLKKGIGVGVEVVTLDDVGVSIKISLVPHNFFEFVHLS